MDVRRVYAAWTAIAGRHMNGLKDHQISQMATAITEAINTRLLLIRLPDSLRVIVSEAIVKYLNENGLRIDKK